MKINKRKVQLRMAKLGINQPQLAERAGTTKQTITNLMKGKGCKPETFGRIAKALEVEPEDIIADED